MSLREPLSTYEFFTGGHDATKRVVPRGTRLAERPEEALRLAKVWAAENGAPHATVVVVEVRPLEIGRKQDELWLRSDVRVSPYRPMVQVALTEEELGVAIAALMAQTKR